MPTSSKTNSFKGIYTALVTPFLPDGAVDWRNYERLLDAQLEAGVNGVVPCGTTGESPTLTDDEKRKLIETAVKKCKGRAQVIAGTGSNDTLQTIRSSRIACELGADALLVVVPYYNKPSQAGLEAHFQAVADESSAPVILYNVPGRTGISIAPATVAKLAAHPKIAGIKEASGNIATLTEMRVAVTHTVDDKPFAFLSGDDVTFWPFMRAGGHGVISVASNIIPREMVALLDGGLELHEKLSHFFNMLFVEANPVPIKTALSWTGAMNAKVRLPLVGLQPENVEKLRKAYDVVVKK